MTHVLGGVVGVVLCGHPTIGLYIGAIIGSCMPDIDSPSSAIGRKLPGISHVAGLSGHRGIFHSPILLAVSTFGLWWLGHFNPIIMVLAALLLAMPLVRTFFWMVPWRVWSQVWFAVLVGMVVVYLAGSRIGLSTNWTKQIVLIRDSLVWGYCIGYFSHLVLDSLTPRGVPWLRLPRFSVRRVEDNSEQVEINWKAFRGGPIRTGSIAEFGLTLALAGFILAVTK